MKYRAGWSDVKIGFEVDNSFSVGPEIIPALLTSDRGAKGSVWDVGVGGSIKTAPLIAGGVVYFGCCDRNFYAVSMENGKELWRFQTNGPISNSKALLHNGILYFGSLDGCLYAINEENGTLVWKFRVQGKIDSSPVIKDGIVYVTSYDKNLYAVSERDGTLIWKFPLDSLSWNLALYGDTLLVPCFSGNLYALSTDKRLLWKFKGQGYMYPIPAVKDDVVFQSCNDDNLYAIDLNTGRLIWKFMGGDSFDTMPSFHGEIIITGNRDNNMYALERKTGRVVWKFKTESMLSWRSVVNDGIVYFCSWDHNIYAVNADNGRLIWKFKTNGPIDGGPAIADNRIVVGSIDCNLYCLDLQGHLIWKFPTSMGTPSRIELVPEQEEEVTVQTIWKETEEEKEKRNEGIEIKDYGGSGNEYASGMSKDYIKGKKGYI